MTGEDTPIYCALLYTDERERGLAARLLRPRKDFKETQRTFSQPSPAWQSL